MQFKNNKIFFSPSDLIIFMESQFASHMERSCLEDPNYSSLMDPEDAMLKNLQKRGFEHEDAFLFSLIASGKKVIKIDRSETREMRNRTQQAMVDGAEVIAQAYLELDNFGGIADFLIKVEGESTLGDYHYEIWDAKLSKKMKPYFAIQLCCYAEMLESEQGRRPEKTPA